VTSSTGAAPNPAIAGGVEDLAPLNTNNDPSSTQGLKLAPPVSSTFGLTTPPTGSYGLSSTTARRPTASISWCG
jgi:hypothetical protein